jgi:hypothetical protein
LGTRFVPTLVGLETARFGISSLADDPQAELERLQAQHGDLMDVYRRLQAGNERLQEDRRSSSEVVKLNCYLSKHSPKSR